MSYLYVYQLVVIIYNIPFVQFYDLKKIFYRLTFLIATYFLSLSSLFFLNTFMSGKVPDVLTLLFLNYKKFRISLHMYLATLICCGCRDNLK